MTLFCFLTFTHILPWDSLFSQIIITISGIGSGNVIHTQHSLKFLSFVLFLTAVAAETPPCVEDVLTSPVKNLQKKTDLFQLQKVFMVLWRGLTDISVKRFSTLLMCKLSGYSHVFQTLLEMNESRRSKKLSPFEALRNEALEFMDNLVKWDILPSCSSESVVHLNRINMVEIRLQLTPWKYFK